MELTYRTFRYRSEEYRGLFTYYEGVLGLKCYNIEVVADQKVKTAFFKVGQTKIELLEPTSEDSTIAKFIEKKGEGIHHIALAYLMYRQL